jgi:hypothetical protein
MSWIDKELKKRVRHSNMPPESATVSESEHMTALWRQLESVNNQLPPELKLPADLDLPAVPAYGVPKFLVWFRAPNGAGLGFTGDAIRYVWPERNEGASYNFWIRWTPDGGFRLIRRVVSSITGPKIVERSFSERRAEYMVKCLVVGRRIRPRAVRKKRLWLF